QPAKVFARWWVRQKQPVLPAWVGPFGQGMRWSMSQRSAGALQPGKQQVMSRARTNRARVADGRYRGSMSAGGDSRAVILAPVRTSSASSGPGTKGPPSTTAFPPGFGGGGVGDGVGGFVGGFVGGGVDGAVVAAALSGPGRQGAVWGLFRVCLVRPPGRCGLAAAIISEICSGV